MSRLTTLLGLVLALQLLLTAAVFWPRENPAENDALAALISLAPEEIDRIIISSGEDSLLLRREGGRWIMPDYHRLPVQQGRLERLRVDLPDLARGWPVASSGSAAERFEVSPERFQRKIGFYRGEDNAGELFVGTSPGFRKVHVRPAGEDRVYAVEFNIFELPVAAGEWLDKSLLRLEEVSAVKGLDYAITREGEAWVGDEGQQPSQEGVDMLVNGLTSLRVTDAADIATASVLDEMEVPPTLTVTADGSRYEFRLYEIEDAYYIQRGDIPVYFSLGPFDYDRLNDVDAESLYARADAGEDNVDAEDSD
jgi:hypothetical protein